MATARPVCQRACRERGPRRGPPLIGSRRQRPRRRLRPTGETTATATTSGSRAAHWPVAPTFNYQLVAPGWPRKLPPWRPRAPPTGWRAKVSRPSEPTSVRLGAALNGPLAPALFVGFASGASSSGQPKDDLRPRWRSSIWRRRDDSSLTRRQSDNLGARTGCRSAGPWLGGRRFDSGR